MTGTLKHLAFTPALTPLSDLVVELRVPTIEHAGVLEDWRETPRYLLPNHEAGVAQRGLLSCSYCGVGDGGRLERVPESAGKPLAGGGLEVYREQLAGVPPTSGSIKLRSSL